MKDLQKIRDRAGQINRMRAEVVRQERGLMKLVAAYIDTQDAGLRDMARRMCISAQYLCDVKYQRRKISAAFLKKLERI